MGLDHNGTRLLLFAKKCGVTFASTLMVGRQCLHIDKKTFQSTLADYGFDQADAAKLLTGQNGYAEPFLTLLGAQKIDSIDASDYEAATLIHDLNVPVSPNLAQAYDVVIDGGSLEHIFNFPVAVKNCMQMVKTGGFFLGITPANNFFGHGFYQFSPELYFRVFSIENGFEIKKLLFYVDKFDARWYDVKDPNEVRTRVTLCNRHPSYLFIMAKKVCDVTPFTRVPQQSDYANQLWKNTAITEPLPLHESVYVKIKRRLTDATFLLKQRLNIWRKDTGSGNRHFFKKLPKSN